MLTESADLDALRRRDYRVNWSGGGYIYSVCRKRKKETTVVLCNGLCSVLKSEGFCEIIFRIVYDFYHSGSHTQKFLHLSDFYHKSVVSVVVSVVSVAVVGCGVYTAMHSSIAVTAVLVVFAATMHSSASLYDFSRTKTLCTTESLDFWFTCRKILKFVAINRNVAPLEF